MAKISSELMNEMNEQLKRELESAYIYLGMATWFEERTLNNLAKWFYIQADEEFEHAMKFKSFILENEGTVTYKAIEEPKQDWQDIGEILEAALEHERFISGHINNLYDKAIELKEHAALPMLLWFIEEQVEEEDSANALLDKYHGYKNDFNFDHHVKRDEE